MIPVNNNAVFNSALGQLREFGRETKPRGRFIALYLGLRRMRNQIPEMGSGQLGASASAIEAFLDRMYTKTNQDEPFVVLTAPFGRSFASGAPYSTRTGEVAPGNATATNTWRNNLNIQKGVGCPAAPDVIDALLVSPEIRLACPHMEMGSNRAVCSVRGTAYRGEEHSIWLRMVPDGYQRANLDNPAAYNGYLFPDEQRIPLFSLIAVLYSFTLSGVYPERATVGIPEFCDDFGFQVTTINNLFDADPDSGRNAEVLAAAKTDALRPTVSSDRGDDPGSAGTSHTTAAPSDLPANAASGQLNTGVGAEVLVARELQAAGWIVEYFGNQRGIGYDLRAARDQRTIFIEVKSSVGFCTPVLTQEEMSAAETNRSDFILAVVDFFGSGGQRVQYVHDPAGRLSAVAAETTSYRIPRASLNPLLGDLADV